MPSCKVLWPPRAPAELDHTHKQLELNRSCLSVSNMASDRRESGERKEKNEKKKTGIEFELIAGREFN